MMCPSFSDLSGTWFRLQLPQGALLKPLLPLTPPSQSTPRTSPEASDGSAMRVPCATIRSNRNNNGSISMFSPSEVSASFLRSATPSESRDDQPGSQSQGQPLFLITGRAVQREGERDGPSMGEQEKGSKEESQRQGVSEVQSQVTESGRENGGTTANDTSKATALDSSGDGKTLQDGEATTSESQAQQNTALTQLSKIAEVPRSDTCRDESAVFSSSRGSTKEAVDVDCSVSANLPSHDVSEVADVKISSPVSPRKSLSLRKTRTPPARNSRRRIIPNGAPPTVSARRNPIWSLLQNSQRKLTQLRAARRHLDLS